MNISEHHNGFDCDPSSKGKSGIENAFLELQNSEIYFVDSEEFSNPDLEEHILSPVPEFEKSHLPKTPDNLPPIIASLYTVPLLNKEQEHHLFRRMNYAKYRASMLKQANDSLLIDDILQFSDIALKDRNMLIQSNMRLAVNLAKKYGYQSHTFTEKLSDFTQHMFHAVEKFDYSRGFRFSTFYYRCAQTQSWRQNSKYAERAVRFVSGLEGVVEEVPDVLLESKEYTEKERAKVISRLFEVLDSREKIVIEECFLFEGDHKKTLQEIGNFWGITKERVRQLRERALGKMRALFPENVQD